MHTLEPWFYHKPFTHKYYKKRDAQGTWLLDMKDYGRAMKCVNSLAGIEDVDGFMKLVRDTIKDGHCPWYTGESDCQTLGRMCPYCQLKTLLPKENPNA